MKKYSRRLQEMRGFSIVELMVVVSIIGILAAIAMPKFKRLQARAKQSEAKSNLAHIYTLEMAYYGEQNPATYGTTTQIGWVDPLNSNYKCWVTGANWEVFTAQCSSERKFCSVIDSWVINQDKKIDPIEGQNCALQD